MRILLPGEIKKAIECPELGDDHYGSWGILTAQQRLSIKHLLDVLDSADYIIKTQRKEIEKYKKEIEKYKNIINKLSNNFISKDKIREQFNKYESVLNDYDIKTANAGQSQDIGRCKAYLELLEED